MTNIQYSGFNYCNSKCQMLGSTEVGLPEKQSTINHEFLWTNRRTVCLITWTLVQEEIPTQVNGGTSDSVAYVMRIYLI